jgi:hypothetical protein
MSVPLKNITGRQPCQTPTRTETHPKLAGVEGLEPPTSGFGDRRSSQLSYTPKHGQDIKHPSRAIQKRKGRNPAAPKLSYAVIFATTPAPTVRPPSRMAKRKPSSIAIGAINSTSIDTLSPGITISTPSGRDTTPVTSVVRK